MESEPQLSELNDDLLEAAAPAKEPPEPKRNSKQKMIDKILEISEKENIPLEHSNTKLKRMNKSQLGNLLAELIEKGMEKKMARTLGISEDADRKTIGLAALRMVHDICASGVEKGGNAFLEPKGYEIEGFVDSLKDPQVSTVIDQCLVEIAEENQELLEYIESPYTRLMICWGGALTFSCKKKQITNAPVMEPRSSYAKNSVRGRSNRRPPNGQVNADLPPFIPHVKSV